jgi:hypothetical protein
LDFEFEICLLFVNCFLVLNLNDPPKIDVPAQKRLRRCILLTLYHHFTHYPYAAIELRQIETDCRADTGSVNWNCVYLEKSGLVELGRSVECPPYVASSISLTADGIDLIEDQPQFDHRFPPPD